VVYRALSLNEVGAVALRTLDHDMVLKERRHLSLSQSSSTSTVLLPAAFGFLHLSHVQKMKGLSKSNQ
jgi:hypothetical protein